MFKVGDRVRIKDELGFKDTCIGNIEELKEKTLTVEEIGDIRGDGSYEVIILGVNWCFRDNWLELVGDEEDKFEAFLREVADQSAPHYGQQWHYLDDLMNSRGNDEETISNLVEFYKTFKPKSKTKLTMSELRDILGYDFEIVED